jgi:hypothetical protein
VLRTDRSPRPLGCHFVCVGSRRRAISPPKRREGDERYRSPDSCGGSSPHAATCRPFVARRLLRLANEADRALLGFLKRNPKATRARTREWISEKLGRTISFDLIDSFADRHRYRFPKVRVVVDAEPTRTSLLDHIRADPRATADDVRDRLERTLGIEVRTGWLRNFAQRHGVRFATESPLADAATGAGGRVYESWPVREVKSILKDG